MIVGTAGHIDHGKTALIKALTGVDADRLPEEKARGITIDLGFAYADLGNGEISGFVDVPGHERLIHTMAAGVGAIDAALLVVAADDGVMPQTREHIAILELLGLTRAIVALSKADLGDAERRAAVTAEIREVLAATSFAAAPIVPVSALTGEGIADLRERLAGLARAIPLRDGSGLFRFAVDRSFVLEGFGTVVTGAVLSGSVAVGDSVTISPAGLAARVRGIHAQNRRAETGRAGQRCALNLSGDGVTKEAVTRGDILVAPVLHAPTNRIDATLAVLAHESRPVGTWFPARLHTHAAEVGARVVPLAGDIAPGGSGLVQLVLDRPLAAAIGDRFILRDVSASRTIGGGRFLDLRAPARKRSTPERLELLTAAQSYDPLETLRRQLAVGPVDMGVFLRDRSLPSDLGAPLLSQLGAADVGGYALSAEAIKVLREKIAATLADFHDRFPDLAGVGREKLRIEVVRGLPAAAFTELLRSESGRGAVVLNGAFVSLPGHTPQMSTQDEDLFARILPNLLGEARFRPPRVRDLADMLDVTEQDVRRVLKLSQRLGRTDQIAHDHFFARDTVREMAAIVVEIARDEPDGWFGAPAFRDRVHNGRKVAIEVLDFFDRLGLTLRRGDLRRINPHRLDLFAE